METRVFLTYFVRACGYANVACSVERLFAQAIVNLSFKNWTFLQFLLTIDNNKKHKYSKRWGGRPPLAHPSPRAPTAPGFIIIFISLTITIANDSLAQEVPYLKNPAIWYSKTKPLVLAHFPLAPSKFLYIFSSQFICIFHVEFITKIKKKNKKAPD